MIRMHFTLEDHTIIASRDSAGWKVYRERIDAYLVGAKCYINRAEWAADEGDDLMEGFYLERVAHQVSLARSQEEFVTKLETLYGIAS